MHEPLKHNIEHEKPPKGVDREPSYLKKGDDRSQNKAAFGMEEREGASPLASPLRKARLAFTGAPLSRPEHVPKLPPAPISSQGVRISTYELRRGSHNVQSPAQGEGTGPFLGHWVRSGF